MPPDLLTIPECFEQSVRRFAKKTAIQYQSGPGWQKISYQDLKQRSLKVAYFLTRLGLKKSDRAAISLENRAEWPMIYLGIMSAGMTCVPLDIQLASEQFNNLLKDSESKVLFCSQEVLKKLAFAPRRTPFKIVVVDAKNLQEPFLSFSRILEETPVPESLPEHDPEDTASLIYTSGTTEKPKGVLLTHKNICSNFLSIKKLKLLSHKDNLLSLLPLHHTYPFMVTLIVPLFMGAKVTYNPPGFRPQDLASVMKQTGVTVLQGVPQLFSLLHSAIAHRVHQIPKTLRPFLMPLIRHRIRSQFGRRLRFLVSGGARLNPAIGRELTHFGLRLTEGYGLTETSPAVTMNPLCRVKFGSVGKALADVKIKISNPDEHGIGEVLIQGPNVMAGYYRRPDLTAEALRGGWFHSGDLGYLDHEGYLFLTGREKEMIVLSSGKKIVPEELEDLYQQSPYIKELCIFSRHEHRFGQDVETLFAVIVPDLEQCQRTQEGNIQAKIRWELENIAKDLAPYKHILGFILTKDELPRTALRKLKRYEVMEKYVNHPSETVLAGLEESVNAFKDMDRETAQKVIQYLSQQLHRPVAMDNHLEIDLGIDSLSRVEMGLGLERLFSITIPDEDVGTIGTVKELIIRVAELRRSGKSAPRDTSELQKTPWQYLLGQTPEASVLKKIQIRILPFSALITAVFKILLLVLFRVFWKLKVRHLSPLPENGPYLLCPNHASYLDGFIVFCGLPLPLALKTYFFGYTLIFEQPFFKWSLKLARLVSIDASVRLTEAMQIAAYLLSRQKIVCLFPEAERSIDGEVKAFRKGIGILIKELNVPVVPVYIKGSFGAWPRGRRFPRPYPIQIVFGKPLDRNDLLAQKAGSDTDGYQTIAQNVREAVMKLSE